MIRKSMKIISWLVTAYGSISLSLYANMAGGMKGGNILGLDSNGHQSCRTLRMMKIKGETACTPGHATYTDTFLLKTGKNISAICDLLHLSKPMSK